jgi:hypothetical protein
VINRVRLPASDEDRRAEPPITRSKVVTWLSRRRGLYADPDVLEALVESTSIPALELTTAVLSVRGWRRVDTRVFENRAYRVEISAECGGHRVDLLFSSRHGQEHVAFDVVSESAAENAHRMSDARAEAIRASGARYVRLTVGNMPKALQWLRDSLKKDLARRTDPFLPPPLLGRIHRDNLDWARVPPPVREVRLQFWLEAHRENVAERFFSSLAQCETIAEMRFLLPILQHVKWELVNRSHLRHKLVDLRIHKEFDGGHFDFIVEHRTSKLFRPVVIEIARSKSTGQDAAQLDHVQTAADSFHYLVDLVKSSDAAARGAWWARLLREAATDERFQAREVDPHGSRKARAVN